MPTAAWTNIAPGKGEPDWRPLARAFRDCRQTFLLHVPSWAQYSPTTILNWKNIPFDSKSQPDDKRGVYAFVLDASRHLTAPLPPFSYVLYVGETGDSSSETLKTRLRNYRNVKAQKNRARVYTMLETWKDSLVFYYAVIQSSVSTKDCQTSLLDVMIPPVNDNDFSATVSNARKSALS